MSIRKLAAATGLSVATVSKALRHDPKVRPATREVVLHAALKIGYSPNPFVGQMMASMRRRNTSSFRGNVALIWKDSFPGIAADIRRTHVIKGVMERAEELGYQIDEFELAANKPESLRRILQARGIRGVLIFMPSFSGAKIRFRMNLDSFSCVSLGWGVWSPELDSVRADYFQMFRLAIHHTRHRFQGRIAAIWDIRTDNAAHNIGRASFVINHPAGPAIASNLFLSWNDLSETAFAKVVKKYDVHCLLLGSSVEPPDWLEHYVPMMNWVWCRDPGKVRHFGQIDPQNSLTGRLGFNLLAAKIQMNEYGVPSQCYNVMVPPRWINGI